MQLPASGTSGTDPIHGQQQSQPPGLTNPADAVAAAALPAVGTEIQVTDSAAAAYAVAWVCRGAAGAAQSAHSTHHCASEVATRQQAGMCSSIMVMITCGSLYKCVWCWHVGDGIIEMCICQHVNVC